MKLSAVSLIRRLYPTLDTTAQNRNATPPASLLTSFLIYTQHFACFNRIHQNFTHYGTLLKFAFQQAQNKNWNLNFYEATNNWNQVCNGGLVCAALASYENNPSEAKDMIEKALESNKPALEVMYSPDGNYPEGSGYWCYGTLYQA